MKTVILILLVVVCMPGLFAQNATLIFKANPEFERYPLELIRETTYGMLSSEKIVPGDSLTISVRIDRPEGEYFRLWGWNALLIYLKPGSRLVVDYKSRARHNTVFEGDVAGENRWLNQEFMLKNSVVYSLPGEDDRWEDFCTMANTTVDSLKSGLDKSGFSADFIRDTRVRLDFLRLLTVQGGYMQLISRRKYALTPADLERWEKEHHPQFHSAFAKEAQQIMARYPEREVLPYIQATRALAGVCHEMGNDFVVRAGYPLFDELYRFMMLKTDPVNLYGQQLVDFAKTVKDTAIRADIDRFLEENGALLAGAEAIDFEYTDIDGKTGRLSDLKGVPLYIDVWATWCNPCKALAPAFQKLAGEYRGKNIRFISISIDSQRAPWLNYLKKQLHPENVMELHTSDKKFMKKYQISGIPRFILIDKDFKIRMAFAYKPVDGSMQELKNMLDQLEKE